jgi:hypothetical protein
VLCRRSALASTGAPTGTVYHLPRAGSLFTKRRNAQQRLGLPQGRRLLGKRPLYR